MNLKVLRKSCDASSSTGDHSSPLRKEINVNENDKIIEIHASFWNCFKEVATVNVQKDEDVEQKSAIANKIDCYMKTVRLKRTAYSYKW